MDFKKDFLASIVVFLVALPLCMGIALASGVPMAYGIISGIVGGLVVGYFTGSPLQVSGPAAGLVVLVWDIVEKHGLVGLGIVTFFAGLLQVTSALLKLGPYFRAISPSVIKGMLSAIGVIIFASQFHVMLDDNPGASPVQNLITIPAAILKIFDTSLGVPHMEAAFIGVVTIMLIMLWNNLKDKYKLVVPGALIGVVATTAIAYFAAIEIKRVSFGSGFEFFNQEVLLHNNLGSFSMTLFWLAIPLAFIATAETLLCTNAVERMRPEVSTDYNKELFAQGIGNTICGFLGALPMTGVIVRSSANVEAGANTKWSAIMHGLWLLILVASFTALLQMIPTATLAAVLVLTGVKLMNLKELIKTYKTDKADFFMWLTTLVAIIATNLLVGIAIGFAVTLLHLVWSIHNLEIKHEEQDSSGKVKVKIIGKASFLNLPSIVRSLDNVNQDSKHIELDLHNLLYRDNSFNDYISNLKNSLGHRGVTLSVNEPNSTSLQ